MKKLLLIGIAAAALFGAPAIAAEMPLKAVADPLFNWTGWYLGGNTGYSWGDSRTTITSGNGTTPVDARIRHKGWEFSGEGGYCWQLTNATVDCIEIRYDGPREKGRITPPVPPDTVETSPRPPSTILIGPHLGMLTDMNHMLWYLAGGLALGESGASTFIDGNALNTSDKWKAGWFLGAGVERMIDKHWSWKLEYDYVRMGGGGVSATYPAGTIFVVRGNFVNPVTVNSNKDSYDNKISFGINYHFGSN